MVDVYSVDPTMQSTDSRFTETSPPGKKNRLTTAYCQNFEQHLIDHQVYPPLYQRPDDSWPAEARNLDVITDRLAQRRPSLSTDTFTKEDFQKLSSQIVEYVVKRHQSKPLYATFVEQLARDISEPLKDVEVRKVASSLTTLANEKQKEQREKASGKKKKAGKPILGGSKTSGKGYVQVLLVLILKC